MSDDDFERYVADKAEVHAWMRQHAGEHPSAALLAHAANEHFRRPFHINVMQDWARKVMNEREET